MRRLITLIRALPPSSALAAALPKPATDHPPSAPPAGAEERVMSVSQFRSWMTGPNGPTAV